ncbi:MAG TPA: hypothetical protein G4O03_00525 [Dehalococcoidia bacterium]|nr:hypothetical protein [Dehalococcoidia bacterium]
MMDLAKAYSFIESLYYAPKKLLRVDKVNRELVLSGSVIGIRALRDYNPEMAENLRQGLAAYGMGSLNTEYFDVLFGRTVALPFRGNVETTLEEFSDAEGGWRVWTELRRGNLMFDWQEYADLALLGALDYFNTRRQAEAEAVFDTALAMWAGWGFMDRYSRTRGYFHTYPLGLALYVSRAIGKPIPASVKKQIDQVLRLCQTDDGGIITLYDFGGMPFGTAAEEPTCAAVLGYIHEHKSAKPVSIWGGWL